MFEPAAFPTPPGTPSATDVDTQNAIDVLQAACRSRTVHQSLERLLSQPRELRKVLVEAWVREMQLNEVSPHFVQAVSSLAHGQVADRAFQTLFPDARASRPVGLGAQH